MSKQPENAPVDPNLLNPESDLPPDADMEERFNDFWKKNGLSVFGAIALGAAVVVGKQTYDYLQVRAEEDTQTAFVAADTVEDKLAFASEHESHTLGGLALLQTADTAYEAGDFSTAAARYADAQADLGGTPLAGRAQLGEGMALLRHGDAAAGQQALERLSLNLGALDHFRAEAAYQLAFSRWEAGNIAGARTALEVISALDNAANWEARAAALEEQLPEG